MVIYPTIPSLFFSCIKFVMADNIIRNLGETFHYDKMNRLTDIYLGTTHRQIVYDPVLPNLNSGAASISI